MNFQTFEKEQWESLVDLLAKILKVPAVSIFQYEAPFVEILVTSRTAENPLRAGTRIRADQLYCDEVIQARGEVLLPDSRQDPRWKDSPLVEMGLIAYLGLPLLFPDGTVFGTIAILDNRENHFLPENRDLLFQIKCFIESQLKLTFRKDQVVQRNLDLELIQENLIGISQELKAKNRDLEDFANFVSHDLKEPLRKIKFFGSKARNADSGELREQMLDSLTGAADRMERLIDSFLELSQVGTRPGHFRKTDLNMVLEEVVESLIADGDSSNIRIDKGLLLSVEVDPSQMHQLFLNLLSNAVKFKDESRPCHIRISSVDLPNDRCEIQVQDNGRGFEMKYARKVFEPLMRLNNSSVKRGAGLGLAIAKKVVEFHKGSIRAESVPNQGASFFISLPLSQQD